MPQSLFILSNYIRDGKLGLNVLLNGSGQQQFNFDLNNDEKTLIEAANVFYEYIWPCAFASNPVKLIQFHLKLNFDIKKKKNSFYFQSLQQHLKQ